MASYNAALSPSRGELHAEYKHSVIGMVALTLILTAVFAWVTWMAATSNPPSLWFAFLAGVFTLGWLGFCLWEIAQTPRHIQIYDEGLLVMRPWEQFWFAWDEFADLAVSYEATQGILAVRIKLQMQDGRRFSFGGLPKQPRQPEGATIPLISIDILAEGMQEASAYGRFRHLKARYDAGQTVAFKQLTASQAGITWKGQTLTWPLVSDIHTDGFILIIKAQGQTRPWAMIRLSTLSNQDLLPPLIEYANGNLVRFVEDDVTTEELRLAQRTFNRRRRLWNYVAIPLVLIAINGSAMYASYYFGWKGYMDRGEAALERGDFPKAISDFDQLIAKQPEYGRGYILRGVTHSRAGNLEAARADLALGLQYQPNSAWGQLQYGAVLAQLERHPEAIDAFNEAIRLFPRYGIAYCVRGESYLHLQQIERARADFTDCREHAQDAQVRAIAEEALRGLSR